MKNLMVLSVLIAAILFVGCGKSDLQKKMETELNAAIMKLHDGQMASMKTMDDLTKQLDEVASMDDSLTRKNPKAAEGHSMDDLKAAKEKLAAVKADMTTWMSGHKPYDENMKHEEVMAQLTKDKDALTKIAADGQAAMSAATAAIESHKAFVQDLMAKATTMVKKAGKH